MSGRVGIFSGTFDPVHKGHIAFALSAIEAAKLDKVYFAPESLPRRKPGVTHLSHRVAMLMLATRMHPNLNVIEFPEKYFSPATTMPKLMKMYKNDGLFIMVGSDLLDHLGGWPRVDFLLQNSSLIVGLRSGANVANILEKIMSLPRQPLSLRVVETLEPTITSHYVRHSIRGGHQPRDVLTSVYRYAKQHWLYDAVSAE